jgi:hypothetical protein
MTFDDEAAQGLLMLGADPERERPSSYDRFIF